MDDVLTVTIRWMKRLLSMSLRIALVALLCSAALDGGPVLGQRSGGSGSVTNSTPACVQPPAGLSHWWTADSTAADFQGGRTGTNRGQVTYATGKVAEAFSFNGTNGVVEASIPFDGLDGWVLAAWVNWKGFGGNPGQKGQGIFYHGDPGRNGYGLFIIGPGWCSDFHELCFRGGELGVLYGGVRWYFPELKLAENTWTHVALARSDRTLKLYFNGVLVWLGPMEEPLAPTGSFAISRDQPLTFNGLIDEVTVFTSPLDNRALASFVAAGSAGMCKAPAFTAISGPNTGFIDLSAQGQRNQNITVLSSPDLATWESVLRFANSNGVFRFSVPVNRAAGQTFYRLIQTK